jgi:2-aminophenol/2-amino-5-chlorophenol 1,6-dioxygenase alpha subunit
VPSRQPSWDKPIVGISSNGSYFYYSNDVGQAQMHALGVATRKAVEATGRRALLLASNSLSHRHFTTEPETPEDMSHEHIYHHGQYLWDMHVLELMRTGRTRQLFDELPDFIDHSESEVKPARFVAAGSARLPRISGRSTRLRHRHRHRQRRRRVESPACGGSQSRRTGRDREGFMSAPASATAGRVVRGYIVPGMPQPLLVPEQSPAWKSLRAAFERLRREIEATPADLLLLYSTQWISIIGHQIQADPEPEWVHVDPEWHELGSMPYKFRMDAEFAAAYEQAARARGLHARTVAYHGFPIDTGTVVALKLLNPDNRLPACVVSCNMYADRAETLVLGKAAQDAVRKTGKRCVAIAVTALSNRLFTEPIDPAQDRISSLKDDEWNRKLLEILAEGRLEDVSQLAREFSLQANGDQKLKAIWWLAATMGQHNRYDGQVFDYQPVWGTGAAIVGMTPATRAAADQEFDEEDVDVYGGDRNVLSTGTPPVPGPAAVPGPDAATATRPAGASNRPAGGSTRPAGASAPALQEPADSIRTDTAPKPVGAYPHARRVGELLFVSGIGPRDPATDAVPGGPVRDARGRKQGLRHRSADACHDRQRATHPHSGRLVARPRPGCHRIPDRHGSRFRRLQPRLRRILHRHRRHAHDACRHGVTDPDRRRAQGHRAGVKIHAKGHECPRIIDISPLVSERIGVFPAMFPTAGKTSLRSPRRQHRPVGDPHDGCTAARHADAPNHYVKDGVGIAARPLDPLLRALSGDAGCGAARRAARNRRHSTATSRAAARPVPHRHVSRIPTHSTRISRACRRRSSSTWHGAASVCGDRYPSIDPCHDPGLRKSSGGRQARHGDPGRPGSRARGTGPLHARRASLAPRRRRRLAGAGGARHRHARLHRLIVGSSQARLLDFATWVCGALAMPIVPQASLPPALPTGWRRRPAWRAR